MTNTPERPVLRLDWTDEALVGRVLDRRYRLDQRIARGGMAWVFTATDERLDRQVAVKVMHPSLGEDESFIHRFEREARAAAKLTHPNVVAVHDQGQDEETGAIFLVMEYVPGRTLRQVIESQTPLAPSVALDYLEPILSALAAAHDAGLIHRDVKPENVLVGVGNQPLSDQVKVADFGLAKAITSEAQHTATGGLLVGTVSYLAPELVVDGSADPRADVYAAGVILFELLTGRPPHVGDSAVAVAYKHVHEDVPLPSSLVPGIPSYVDALVARATSRGRASRPADAAALLEQVRQVRKSLADGIDDAELASELRPLGYGDPDFETPVIAGSSHVAMSRAEHRGDEPSPADPAQAADPAAEEPAAAEPAAALHSQPQNEPSEADLRHFALTETNPGLRLFFADEFDDEFANEFDNQVEPDYATFERALELPGEHALEPVTEFPTATYDATLPAPSLEKPPVVETGKPEVEQTVESELKAAAQQATSAQAGAQADAPAGGKRRAKQGAQQRVKQGAESGATDPAKDPDEADPEATQIQPVLAVTEPPRAKRSPEPDVSEESVWHAVGTTRSQRVIPILIVVALILALAGGGAAWWLTEGRYAAPPPVVDLPANSAQSKLQAAGFKVEVGDPVFSETIPEGSVARTIPAPGEQVLRGSTITIVVSRGKELYPVPQVRGQAEAAAQAMITKAKLKPGTTKSMFSERVPAGHVIGTVPKPGAQTSPQTPITLVVSKGRRPIPVTNFIGKSGKSAQDSLTAAGFKVSVSYAFSDTVPEGVVGVQSPSSGSLFRGDSVAIVISQGVQMATVPTGLINMPVGMAQTRLQAAGFQVQITRLPLQQFQNRVLSVKPTEGTSLPYGSVVTLTIY